MRVIGVIPARYGSTRFPGKPLHPLLGKPLLQWVIEAARSARTLDELWVATDHEEIFALAESLSVKAVLTPSDLVSGSDRVYFAIRNEAVDVVVNIQGDEPLISGSLLDQLVAPMVDDAELPMATLARDLKAGDLESLNTAKIILNEQQEAIYFSRFPIPYSRENRAAGEAICVKHIGLYAFRKDFLARFCTHGATAIELAEGLEQLRALYLGARIKVTKVDHESWGVDTPHDVAKVEELLIASGKAR